jgi:replicative DNA helicase
MSSTPRFDSARRPKVDTDILGRQPPYDSQAEIGVLGSIMLLPDVLDDVVMIIRPDDFYDDAHRKLFEHMCLLHSGNKKIDPTLLIDRMKMAGDFELIGGSGYLSKIINAVPNAAHATFYAEIVRQKSTFRSLITAATEILREAYDESQEAPQMLSNAEQKIFSILDERGDAKVESIKDVLHASLDRLDARMKGEHMAGGCDYGFNDLDQQTSGLHKSELVIIAARPSMGKTAFAMNIAENVSLGQKAPCLFVSLEMSAIELADRLLCSVAKVNGHRLRTGTISQDDRNRIVEKASLLSEAPLFVDDSPARTVTEIAASARRIKRRMGQLGLIIIDYLQLIEPDSSKDPRQEQVAKIARRLKGLAREMEVPVICLAQLNRQTEASKDNIPRLSHLRESGAIEQDADVVMFVHREEYYARGEDAQAVAGQAQIIVAKQRNGPIGEVEMIFRKEFTRFEDKAPARFDSIDAFNSGGGGF